MKQTKESEIIEDWIIEENCELKGKNVLEVGCGTGKYTFRIVKGVNKIIAFDPSKEAIETAINSIPKNLSNKIKFFEGSADNINFVNEKFNTIFCPFSFHEIPHEIQRKSLEEFHRILKPNGQLALIDPTPESFLHNFVRIIKQGEEHGIRVHESNEKIWKAIDDGLFVKEKYLSYTKDYTFENIEALHTEIVENWARMNKPKSEEERKNWIKQIDEVVGYKINEKPIIITELVQLFVLRKV